MDNQWCYTVCDQGKNLCLDKDLTSSVKFATSGSNITVMYTAEAGSKGFACVYALIGSEQAIK